MIPHVFRKVVDEILVELHLLSHQEDFKTDSIFSIGLTKTFEDFTKGYKPKEHLEDLFIALCNCTNINALLIKKESEKALTSSRKITITEIKDLANKKIDKLDIFAGENKVYNRLSIIGIYTLVKNILDDNENKKDNIEIETKDITIKIGRRLNYPEERVEKDISQYLVNNEKIKQALELIALLNKKGEK